MSAPESKIAGKVMSPTLAMTVDLSSSICSETRFDFLDGFLSLSSFSFLDTVRLAFEGQFGPIWPVCPQEKQVASISGFCWAAAAEKQSGALCPNLPHLKQVGSLDPVGLKRLLCFLFFCRLEKNLETFFSSSTMEP